MRPSIGLNINLPPFPCTLNFIVGLVRRLFHDSERIITDYFGRAGCRDTRDTQHVNRARSEQGGAETDVECLAVARRLRLESAAAPDDAFVRLFEERDRVCGVLAGFEFEPHRDVVALRRN